MDPQAAVARLIELQTDGDIDPELLDEYFDETALELLSALCTCLSFAVAGGVGSNPHHERAREQVSQCVSAINMVFEVWEMADVEIVHEPYLDEYALGWVRAN